MKRSVDLETKLSSSIFSQKTNKWICFSILMTRKYLKLEMKIFLGEVTPRQFCFEIYWPLEIPSAIHNMHIWASKKTYFYKICIFCLFYQSTLLSKIVQEIHTHCPTGPNQLKFPIHFYKHISPQDSIRRTLAEVYNGWGPYAGGAAPHTHTYGLQWIREYVWYFLIIFDLIIFQ